MLGHLLISMHGHLGLSIHDMNKMELLRFIPVHTCPFGICNIRPLVNEATSVNEVWSPETEDLFLFLSSHHLHNLKVTKDLLLIVHERDSGKKKVILRVFSLKDALVATRGQRELSRGRAGRALNEIKPNLNEDTISIQPYQDLLLPRSAVLDTIHMDWRSIAYQSKNSIVIHDFWFEK